MTALDRLIDALAVCIVAHNGRTNREQARLVLAEIEAQGWRLVPPKEEAQMESGSFLTENDKLSLAIERQALEIKERDAEIERLREVVRLYELRLAVMR